MGSSQDLVETFLKNNKGKSFTRDEIHDALKGEITTQSIQVSLHKLLNWRLVKYNRFNRRTFWSYTNERL